MYLWIISSAVGPVLSISMVLPLAEVRQLYTSWLNYTSSISAMLRDLEWPTLEQRRHLSRLTMLYKIYNHLVDTDFTSQLTLRQSSTRGHASRFLQPQCSCCAAYSNSFLPRTVRDWNALAADPLLFQTVFKNYRHFVTSVFNRTTFFIRRKRGLPSRCAFVFS